MKVKSRRTERQYARFHVGKVSTLKVEQAINVASEVVEWRKLTKRYDIYDRIKLLEQPNTLISMYWIARNVVLFLACVYAFNISEWTLLFTAPFAARAMRALGNQVHDFSHRNGFVVMPATIKWNRVVGQWILAPILLYDFDRYVYNHGRHHGWLGTYGADDDVLCYAVHINESDSLAMAFWKVYHPLFLSWKVWFSSIFGDLFKMSREAYISTATFWGVTFLLFTAVFGVDGVISLVAYYFLVRASFYHVVKCFAELSDHPRRSQSDPTEVLSIATYTRTMPSTWLSWFLYPENDGWHLLHHVNLSIPMPNLGKAHKLMQAIPEYAEHAVKYDSFFTGKKSLIKDLVGRL